MVQKLLKQVQEATKRKFQADGDGKMAKKMRCKPLILSSLFLTFSHQNSGERAWRLTPRRSRVTVDGWGWIWVDGRADTRVGKAAAIMVDVRSIVD